MQQQPIPIAKFIPRILVALAFACGLSQTVYAQLGSGWSPTSISFNTQIMGTGSISGDTFGLSGTGRAERRYATQSSGTEQFEGYVTINSFSGNRVSVKQTFLECRGPWQMLAVRQPNQFYEVEVSGQPTLGTFAIGVPTRVNTIMDVGAGTVRVYLNGVFVEQLSGGCHAIYDKLGAYATASGTGPISVTWTGVQFWRGGRPPQDGGPTSFTITASAGPNGSIDPSGAISVLQGDNATFTFTPNPGYFVNDVVVDGSSVATGPSYTFSDVQGDHTIYVSFAPVRTHTITATAGPNGSIDPSGTISVAEGTDQCFNIIPDPGYVEADLVVDGRSVTPSARFCFPNVQTDHTISATFRQGSNCVVASVDGPWQNTPMPPQTGPFTATFDATPSASSTNALVALSNGPQTVYDGFAFACLVRFYTGGLIDARNGPAYAADSAIAYSGGMTYHFRLVVDMGSHSYSIYVTPPGGSEQTLGSNYVFRDGQTGIATIDNWGALVAPSGSGGDGTLTVCNFSIN